MILIPGQPNAELNALTLRERLRQLGHPTWRCDLAGRILIEPGDTGARGLWYRSAWVGDQISSAVAQLGNASEAVITELRPAMWLICVPEINRSKIMGWTVIMLLGRPALESQAFEESCLVARIDMFSTRRSLLLAADSTRESVTHLCSMLNWMNRDLAEYAEQHSAIEGFTRDLSNSYETINLLYGIGRSMDDLNHPIGFLQVVCNRLKDCLAFAWIAAIADQSALGITDPGRFVHSGALPEAVNDFGENLQLVLAAVRAKTLESPGMHRPTNDAQLFGSQLVVQPILRGTQIIGAIVAGDKGGEDPHVSSYDTRAMESAAVYAGAYLENARLYREQQQLYMGTIEALSTAIDAKDPYTCGHSRRVAYLAAQVAAAAGFTKEQAERVHIAGLVHDIGKIGVPEAVLCKPGRLNDEEFALIKQHPEIGHRILKDIPQLRDVLPGVLYHHERFDGKGYPHGLAGEQIPLIARVLCVADTVDAMSSTRSYRAAMPQSKVIEEIARCAGTQFDPALAAAFSRVDLTEYFRMVERDRLHAAPPSTPSAASPPAPASTPAQPARAA